MKNILSLFLVAIALMANAIEVIDLAGILVDDKN